MIIYINNIYIIIYPYNKYKVIKTSCKQLIDTASDLFKHFVVYRYM